MFNSTRLAYIWENIGGFFLLWLAVNTFCLLIIFLVFKKPLHKTLRVVTFNVLLFIIFINTFFLAGEIYFRFIFDYSGSLGNLKTSKRWLARHVRYNTDFFRDRNFSTVKPQGVIRIGVVGDSFAYGWGVSDVEKRFSNRLEKKLNRGNPSLGVTPHEGLPLYEVYNISKAGWESKNELEFLQKQAEMFNFDTIILAYFLNDIYHDRALNIDFINPQITTLTTNPVFKWLIDRSFFLEFMTALSKNYFGRSIEDATQREMVIYRDPKSWENHQKTLSQIINLSQERRQKLVVVIFPYLDLVNQKPYPAAFVHQQLGEFFAKNTIETIDLYSPLKDYPPKILRVNPYDYHPSPLVHQIVADLLYEKLK